MFLDFFKYFLYLALPSKIKIKKVFFYESTKKRLVIACPNFATPYG